jgi:glycosyltransferase involved in cell wall biosynthesis
MKVLVINTSEASGGAAIASWRLAQGLARYHGVTSRFLVRNKATNDSSVVQLLNNSFERSVERKLDRLLTRCGFPYRAFPFSTPRILEQAAAFRPDIISLHNLHGGYFSLDLLPILATLAPLVWTLHDMWSFTNNAAYTFGDDSWQELRPGRGERKLNPKVGVAWGNHLLKQKLRIYGETPFTVVTPSRWLQGEASRSPVFAGKNIRHIFNGIDQELYAPHDRREVRRELGIPADVPVVTFSADIVWKFGGIMPEILAELDRLTTIPIHLLIIGNADVSFLDRLTRLTTHRLGYVHEQSRLARLLAAGDLLIYPSKADNLPNVLVEAISCGVPCVTFDVGGCGEIIRDGISGGVVKPFDVRGFAVRTLELLSGWEELSRLALTTRKYAEDNFSWQAMAERYHVLFNELIAARR